MSRSDIQFASLESIMPTFSMAKKIASQEYDYCNA